MNHQPIYADDATERISFLLKLRLPWLFLGLLGGIITTLFIGQFEKLLAEKVELAFFIPIIVYIADAVGTQTEDIYIRNLAKQKVQFVKYFSKELVLGIVLGTIFGICTGAFAFLWLKNLSIAFSVGLAMLASVSVATMVALVIPNLFYREHSDPAVGAGPLKTVIQDFITIIIYFLVATLIIFH